MVVDQIRVPLPKVMKELTIKISLTGVRTLQFKIWLGIKIIKLGVAVIGCKADIKTDN